MAEIFCLRIRQIRLSKTDGLGRVLSQEKAARLFDVSTSTWRGWEHNPPRSLPDNRSRIRLQELWPELFQAQ